MTSLVRADALALSLNKSHSGALPKLIVDSNAFRSSKKVLQALFIEDFDVCQLDFKFLKGFQRLNQISCRRVFNLHRSLPTLPALPSLSWLDLGFWRSSGLLTQVKKWCTLVHKRRTRRPKVCPSCPSCTEVCPSRTEVCPTHTEVCLICTLHFVL